MPQDSRLQILDSRLLDFETVGLQTLDYLIQPLGLQTLDSIVQPLGLQTLDSIIQPLGLQTQILSSGLQESRRYVLASSLQGSRLQVLSSSFQDSQILDYIIQRLGFQTLGSIMQPHGTLDFRFYHPAPRILVSRFYQFDFRILELLMPQDSRFQILCSKTLQLQGSRDQILSSSLQEFQTLYSTTQLLGLKTLVSIIQPRRL